jgi:hypothetical protein
MTDDTSRLLDELTLDRINEITRTTAGHIARVKELVGYGREGDLPFPRRLTELAYLKGIAICGDEQHRNLMIGVYCMLDDVMLPDDEYSVMVEHSALLRESKELSETVTVMELAARLNHPRSRRGVEILSRLTEAAHGRMAQVDKLLKRT